MPPSTQMLCVDALQVKVPISGRAHPVGRSEDGLTIKQCQSWPSLSQAYYSTLTDHPRFLVKSPKPLITGPKCCHLTPL